MTVTYSDFVSLFDYPPTPEQEKVILSDEPAIIVVAGAGSGKTATMSQRIAWHVAAGNVKADEVLGLTFTRKAAGELATRVMSQLNKVKARFGNEINSAADSDDIADAMHESTARPTILTYNSFASQIASSYAMLIGEDPRSRLIQEAERWQIMEKIVTDSMNEVIREAGFDPANNDSPLALRAISSIISDSLALSSALIDNGVSPEDLRAQIHSEFAYASELREVQRVPPKTFTSGGGQADLAKKAWTELKALGEKFEYRLSLIAFVEKYFDYKKAHSVAEFADQVAWASAILETNERVRDDLKKRYKLIILDEYQDTSVNQARFLNLAFGGDSGSQWRSICAVGDPNQAIYSWRGASANALSDFTRDFAVSSSARLTLSTAFRNGRTILDVANLLTHAQRGKLDYGERLRVKELVSPTSAHDGEVEWIHEPLREDSARQLVAKIRDAMGNIDSRRVENGAPLATAAILCRKRKYIPTMVAALEEAGVAYEVVGGQSLLERKEVVLVRALLALTVNPQRNSWLVPLMNFFAIGAWDVRELGRITRESDTGSLVATLAWLNENPNAMNLSDEGRTRLLRLAKILEQMRQARLDSVPQAVHAAIDLLDLEMYAGAMRRSNRTMSALGSFVTLAHQYATSAQTPTLAGFVEWIDLVEEKENQAEDSSSVEVPLIDEDIEPESGVVQVLTVHASKGLEWDVVGVPEMNHQEFDTEKYSYQVWQTTASLLPYPLRQDREYLPDFTLAGRFQPGEFASVAARYRCDKDAHSRQMLASLLADIATDYARYRYEDIPEHAASEERRLAYVAFTRPKQVLILASYDFADLQSAKKFADNFHKKGEFIPSDRGQFLADVEKLLPTHGHEHVISRDENRFTRWAKDVDLASVRIGEPVLVCTQQQPKWPLDVNRSLDRVTTNPRSSLQLTDEERESMISDWKNITAGFIPDPLKDQYAYKPHYTASDVVSAASDAESFWRNLARPIPLKPSRASRVGTEVHAEIAHYFQAPATLDLDAVWDQEADELSDERVEILVSRFHDSPYSNVAPLAVERACEMRIGDTTVRCVIDAVLDTSTMRGYSPVTIVDWKTGRRPNSDLLDARVLQLQLYRLVWSKTHNIPLDQIGSAFYYLGEEDELARDFRPQQWDEDRIIEKVSTVLRQPHQ
ncbi:UvrD-helicase domain-containing protein [Arcanobacterium canis]|uniref:DNA 3'-5' helicase n=1 Tax=Arcanobacterium canis TaxID=999183 RepID=A0ABY8G1Y6_9ACTO|nr:UvrD-helicase domain-containing protein [Arcanobacterium canis]WFM83881.1 UvrD-helicase domain-containing protein [Arcanobacterium canis]